MIATFNPITNGTFQLGGPRSEHAEHSAKTSQLLLVPSSAAAARPRWKGRSPPSGPNPEAAVPEPSTIALFLSTVGGLGLRKIRAGSPAAEPSLNDNL